MQVAGRPIKGKAIVLMVAAAALMVLIGVGATMVGGGDKVEAVVMFPQQPTTGQIAAVRQGCPTASGVVLEPPDRNNLATTRRYPIRYDVTKASASQKAKLYACLAQYGANVTEESPAD